MKEIIKTDLAPKAVGPYSQAVKAGGFIFVSGQFGTKMNGTLVGESIEAQTEMAILNLKAIVEAGGSSLANAVKITVMLTEGPRFMRMNDEYAKYLDPDSPARSTIICGLVKPGALIEIDGIFIVGD